MSNKNLLMASKKSRPKAKPLRGELLAIAGLLLLSAIPLIAGTIRVRQLTVAASVTPITPANERFFASPVPVIAHIVAASIYSVLGALQFSPTFRHRYPRWHHRIGWLLIPFGFASSLSGLWMTQFYPKPDGDGPILYMMRMMFGTVMTLALGLSVMAITRKKFILHGVWMTRAYAIGMGAGTQVLTSIVWLLLGGASSGEFARNVTMGSAWIINIIVAEWVIHRRVNRPKRKAALASVQHV